ncbi:hypothetical protein PHLGIDRAFT_373612 [Phlebiopsis gigantea 11061_1 CR5-6]|uniref:Uncharacterized protein n=1 Tax=Phlebiopsis gigantea (strain 11061_1 CR5-6) TaxID=745531 RepID=A0A0C3S9U1_PHLG1|nr:hypothetical protein PHLGIDRAFT_373612 [Phlebiopsis gigantea 11061_1 CR5-6]
MHYVFRPTTAQVTWPPYTLDCVWCQESSNVWRRAPARPVRGAVRCTRGAPRTESGSAILVHGDLLFRQRFELLQPRVDSMPQGSRAARPSAVQRRVKTRSRLEHRDFDSSSTPSRDRTCGSFTARWSVSGQQNRHPTTESGRSLVVVDVLVTT